MGPTGLALLGQSERAELERLRSEYAKLKIDNEFLGKASAPISPPGPLREHLGLIQAEQAKAALLGHSLFGQMPD